MVENKEGAMFAAVISGSIDGGHTEWKISTINNLVPIETVIIQLKSLTKNLENDYFDSFNNR